MKKDVLLKLMIKGFLRNLDDREEFYGEYLCVKFLASHLNSIIPIFHQKDVRTGTPVSPEKIPAYNYSVNERSCRLRLREERYMKEE